MEKMEEMEEMKEISCEEARKLVKSANNFDRWILARAKLPEECARKIFPRLSKDKDGVVRRQVAENENTPKECARKIFPRLSKDKNWLVRSGVAGNQAIPDECCEKVFKRLERDGHLQVLETLQQNPLYKRYKEFKQKGS